jgi:putative transposase
MRRPRIKAQGLGFYHCMSRSVEGRIIFPNSGMASEEGEKFVQLMYKLERFSGVRVLTFVLMSTHYHIVCEVPEPVELSDAEFLSRIEALYGPARRDNIARQLHYWTDEVGAPEEAQRIRSQFVRRMFDLSIFNKELKGGFTQWYNRRHRRFGPLWAERFTSVLVQGGQALAAIAAYTDLNPIRAGLCTDPKEYRYCGYAEAVAKPSSPRRSGIRTAMGLVDTVSWNEVASYYRKFLFQTGLQSENDKRAGFDLRTVQRVVEQEEGQLSVTESLRCRIRYFSAGAILGSRAFVEHNFEHWKERFKFKRPRSPYRVETFQSVELWAFHNPRVQPTG